MDDNNGLSTTDSFKSYFQFTRKRKLREASSALEQDSEAPETIGATSEQKTDPFVKSRVSWTRRVLSWFRGD